MKILLIIFVFYINSLFAINYLEPPIPITTTTSSDLEAVVSRVSSSTDTCVEAEAKVVNSYSSGLVGTDTSLCSQTPPKQNYVLTGATSETLVTFNSCVPYPGLETKFWQILLTQDINLNCNYQCPLITDSECVSETGNSASTFSTDLCLCTTPCLPPEGSGPPQASFGTDATACSNFMQQYNDLGYTGLSCHGCPDSLGNIEVTLYGMPPVCQAPLVAREFPNPFGQISSDGTAGGVPTTKCVDINDIDGDGISNNEDDDIDGDGILNENDLDMDGDGINNTEDDDIDGDGELNSSDTSPNGYSCLPLSNFIVNVTQNDCSGQMTNYDNGTQGSLTYQTCNSSCYMLEALPIPCINIGEHFKALCDSDLNNFAFSCDEGTTTLLPAFADICKPKNEEKIINPCDAQEIEMKTICNNENKTLIGACTTNGVIITDNTFECIDKLPDCSNNWHEHLNTSNNICECDVGFVRSTFGDCWQPLFPDDGNLTAEQKAQNKKGESDLHDSTTSEKTAKDTNSTLKGISNQTDTTNDTLAGLRSDLNTSNALLNKIADSLNGENDTNTSVEPLVSDKDQIEYNKLSLDFINDVKGAFSTIKTDFDNMSERLEGGFEVNSHNAGCLPIFSTTVLGRVLTIDLTGTFSYFYSITYFIFTILFILIGLKFFYYGFTIGNRG